MTKMSVQNGEFRAVARFVSRFDRRLRALQSRGMFVADDGDPFAVPEHVRYAWFLRYQEEWINLEIKAMGDRRSFSYWAQWLYPLVMTLLAFLDQENMATYLVAAVGGNVGLYGARKVAQGVLTKAGVIKQPEQLRFRNGGGGPVEVDVSSPLTLKRIRQPQPDGTPGAGGASGASVAAEAPGDPADGEPSD